MEDLNDALVAALPELRAFAISLCGRTAMAEDMVHDTLVKALANIGTFEPGTNLIAWLYTILRHEYYYEYRKRRREVPDEEGRLAARLASRPAQEGHMQLLDFRAALDRLPPDLREALILVGAAELSYEQAAAICRCPVGTMKSRVSRARSKLAKLFAGPVEPDRAWGAAINAFKSTLS
jgi:RNA polymerase sigma-70 factor (ECF subfamily)